MAPQPVRSPFPSRPHRRSGHRSDTATASRLPAVVSALPARAAILLVVWLTAALVWTPTASAGTGTNAGVVIGAGSGTAPGSAEPPAPSFGLIDDYVRERMARTGTPGLAYAVLSPDGPLHEASWGRDGNGAAVTEETPFLWGSVAKPVTATAVLALAEEGRLDLDDPVRDHLPDLVGPHSPGADQVTVRDLLTQAGGVSTQAGWRVSDIYDDPSGTPGERLAPQADIVPGGTEGAEHSYTSANYLILGALVEEVTGRPFADVLSSAVLDPAGMDGAVTRAARAGEQVSPPGHQRLWGITAATASGYDPAGVAYGYLGGGLRDLGAFARLQLNGGLGDGGARVLSAESMESMHTGAVPVPGGEQRYGLGWRNSVLDGPDGAETPIVWHGGATPGFAALLILLPEQERAVVVLQNIYNPLQDSAIQAVGFGVARMVAGGDPEPVPAEPLYPALVAACTAGAVGTLAALVIALHGRRRTATRAPRSGRRRTAAGVAWVAVAVLPATATALLLSEMGLRGSLVWLPDSTTGAMTATVLGTAAGLIGFARSLRG